MNDPISLLSISKILSCLKITIDGWLHVKHMRLQLMTVRKYALNKNMHLTGSTHIIQKGLNVVGGVDIINVTRQSWRYKVQNYGQKWTESVFLESFFPGDSTEAPVRGLAYIACFLCTRHAHDILSSYNSSFNRIKRFLRGGMNYQLCHGTCSKLQDYFTTLWWHCACGVIMLMCKAWPRVSNNMKHIKEQERSTAWSYIAISSISEPSALVEKGKWWSN